MADISLDKTDRDSFGAVSDLSRRDRIMVGPSETEAECISPDSSSLSLDGEWRAEYSDSPLNGISVYDPSAGIPADIPGSVFTALFKAGVIPDPVIGKNQIIARQFSYKYWRLSCEFTWNGHDLHNGQVRFCFGGVANKCSIFINGFHVGSHEGMLSSFCFETDGLLNADKPNCIVVLLDPIPFISDTVFHPECNASWKNTVVINNVYGWHYSNLPSLGIWQSVRLEKVPAAEIEGVLIHTLSHEEKRMALHVSLSSNCSTRFFRLAVNYSPLNFSGKTYSYEVGIDFNGEKNVCADHEFIIPDGKLWWPVDIGEPCLYRISVSLNDSSGHVISLREDNFGIRSIEMLPLPGGPKSDLFNWVFCVNGRKIFVKGSGWCTADALLDLRRERYDRFLGLCRLQHIQMLRAWGCGMPETDDFYDLCDRNGIMVIQEWPTAWNSHLTQPFEMLEETVRVNTLRIRNHPSLVMYGGGNESSDPYGSAIDMMGRLSIELDGTRTFHRGEPFGGSRHNYDSYWGRQSIDHNFTMTAPFWGEFGLASMPCTESVKRYIPVDEIGSWPPVPGSSYEYHTPVFGKWKDVEIMMQYAGYFAPEEWDLDSYIISSQLIQSEGVRHTLERARTRFPECAGALYYKINDNFPAVSWSTIDWFGTAKLSHYAVMNAFEPLHTCILMEKNDVFGEKAGFPVWVMDDAGDLEGHDWFVTAKLYDNELREVYSERYKEIPLCNGIANVGTLVLDESITAYTLVFAVISLYVDGIKRAQSFTFMNYVRDKGCMFRLPGTTLVIRSVEGRNDPDKKLVEVMNSGSVPAVGVTLTRPGYDDVFISDKGFLWFDPGERIVFETNSCEGLNVFALNIQKG
ncbi:MAG: glycoside hydrolase family 2 TIM barrel-domain containing protein [Eubacteriales bacterium]|nr:glycoside hydrolase family 2 TIM barrel-domain containing protein [Eubacteriales bacterium]